MRRLLLDRGAESRPAHQLHGAHRPSPRAGSAHFHGVVVQTLAIGGVVAAKPVLGSP